MNIPIRIGPLYTDMVGRNMVKVLVHPGHRTTADFRGIMDPPCDGDITQHSPHSATVLPPVRRCREILYRIAAPIRLSMKQLTLKF